MSRELLTYEAFLPHHTPSKHRVMAITHTVAAGHTELQALATVPDALTAAQLADALNSRLLARRNHTERLNTVLRGLPDSIRAAVEQLPIDPERAGLGRTPLAAHISTDPIDGLLLFPTTGCPSEGCPDCTDCTNGCDTCPACTADDPLEACELCLPPDLTPRTAHALACAGQVLADGCYDAITTSRAGRDFLPLPHCMTNQTDDFIRRMARCFDDLAHDLHNGQAPELHNLAEQLALHLIINRAEDLHTDQPELLDDTGSLLPPSRHDYAFDTLFDVLFEDDDHIGYLEHHDQPDPPDTLDYLFDPFQPDHDPHRSFRR